MSINLCGINGYIGSGKDTVGSIIRDLTKPAGKVDLGDGLFSREIQVSPWEIKKFAGKLKQIASLLTGVPVERFEDQEFKKTFLPEMWNYMGPSIDGGKNGISTSDLGERQMTVRQFLQKLGTEAMRDGLHTNVWVNALFADFKPNGYSAPQHSALLQDATPLYPNWIITDCRFPNEAQAVKDRGGIVIRVDRGVASLTNGKLEGYEIIADREDHFIPGSRSYFVRKEGHASEVSLDTWKFDYILDNNSGIEELTLKVKEMLQHFGIINLKNEPQSVGG